MHRELPILRLWYRFYTKQIIICMTEVKFSHDYFKVLNIINAQALRMAPIFLKHAEKYCHETLCM